MADDGMWASMLTAYGGQASWNCACGSVFLRIAKSLRTTRLITPGHFVPHQMFGVKMADSGVTTRRAPIPTLNGHASEGSAHFGEGMGWLAGKNPIRVWDQVPEGYGVAVTDVYSELATAGLTQRGAPQVFRRRVRKHSTAG